MNSDLSVWTPSGKRSISLWDASSVSSCSIPAQEKLSVWSPNSKFKLVWEPTKQQPPITMKSAFWKTAASIVVATIHLLKHLFIETFNTISFKVEKLLVVTLLFLSRLRKTSTFHSVPRFLLKPEKFWDFCIRHQPRARGTLQTSTNLRRNYTRHQ